MGSGLKYGEFEFPTECGFSGSAGKSEVKGYMRGGAVKKVTKKTRNTPDTRHRGAKGTTRAQRGGLISGDAPGQQKMGYMGGGNEREISVDGVNISVPRAKGGRAKSTHDKLMAHGKKMGYKTGGAVKVRRSTGNTPDDIGREGIPHTWFWDGREHVDPAKEANGQATRLKNGTTHRAREYGKEGRFDVDTLIAVPGRPLDLGVNADLAPVGLLESSDERELLGQGVDPELLAR